MKRLLVIGGGKWQVPICRKVKEMGYELLNSNLYPDSPGFAYADHSLVADVLDIEKNLAFAREYGADGVLTDQSDIAVETVARVAEELSLPGIGVKNSRLFTDKYEMKVFCEKYGFPIPKMYGHFNSLEDALTSFRKRGDEKPVIIKPSNSQSSRGVYKIQTEEELKNLFDSSLQFSHGEHPSVVMEAYISGTEFTVDGVFLNGKHYTLAISRKRHFAHNKTIASELFFSPDDPDYDYEALRAQHNAMMNCAALPFGLTHTEYKEEDGKFYLIEMAARGGGTRLSSDIVPMVSGIDNYALLIRGALGEELPSFENAPRREQHPYAVLRFLDTDRYSDPEGRRIQSIEGLEEIRSSEGIIDMDLEVGVGDVLKRAEDDRSRAGFYIAYADTREELRSKMEWVENTIRFHYDA